MSEPEDMVLLREMRQRMDDRFDRVDHKLAAHDARFDAHDAQFAAIEKKIDVIKQAAFAESILGRYAVTEVEGTAGGDRGPARGPGRPIMS